MVDFGWLRHALAIGGFEFRRTVRSFWRDKARFGMMVFGATFPALIVLGGLYLFQSEVRGLEAFPLSAGARGSLGLFWLFAVFMAGQRVVSMRSHIEAESMMLMTVSTSAVAGGLMIAETLRTLAYIGLYALLATGVAVVLWGSLPSLVLIPLAALLFASTAVAVGSACGYAVAWIVATSPWIARHKTILGSVGGIALVGMYMLFFLPQLHLVDQAALAWLPMGWLIDLAAIGTPLVGSSLRAGGAVLGSVLLITVANMVIVRETTALWYLDPVSPDSDKPSEPASEATASANDRPSVGGALAAAVKPLVIPRMLSTPTRRVAEWTLLRARREPNRLTYVLMPVIAVGSSLFGSSFDSLDTIAAPAVAIVLPWLAGAVFALNPLGDEGVVLPMTLTAASGAEYVRGLITPGILLGVPVGVAVTAVASMFSPYSLIQQVGLVVLSAFLTCIAAGITPAIGMALPRFSAISVGQSDDVLPPRFSAMAVHLVLVVVPGAALTAVILVPTLARGALAVLVGTLPAFLLTLPDGSGGVLSSAAGVFEGFGHVVRTAGLVSFRAMSIVVLVLGGICIGWVLYRHAIRRFNQFSPS